MQTKFGKLLIIGLADYNHGSNVRVRCECGTEKTILWNRIKFTRSCGCVEKSEKLKIMAAKMKQAKRDKIDNAIERGDKFNRFVVIGWSHYENRQHYVKVRCECGTEKILGWNAVVSGNTKSCGCLVGNRKKCREVQ